MNEKGAEERSRDVLVIGAGNAALCAALAAGEQGARVTVIEAAPEEKSGGNSRFTAGAVRMVYNSVEELEELCGEFSSEEKARTDFGTYSAGQFIDDMGRLTQYRTNPDLCETMVSRSFETFRWMRDKGVGFAPIYGRQAFQVEGRFVFWGGLTLEAWGGGPGLVDSLYKAAGKAGIEILYGARALSLFHGPGGVTGAKVRRGGRDINFRAGAVVLACGGFQANAEWRTRYLGAGWDLAKVRGSRYNVGDGIRMALEAGAMPYGQWSGCHAVGWDLNAPDFGDLRVGDAYQKHSYPLGIMINTEGRRFVDEGADFRNYTYAKYGRAVLNQPGQCAWQLFDRKSLHLLRDEYRIRQVTKTKAQSLEQLAGQIEGMDKESFLKTVSEFNSAVMKEQPFDPNIKDGRGTGGIEPPKSNWANPIDEPPFEAYGITCGITFTFGGLRINTKAQVLDQEEQPIPGLYGAGELVGGLFYFNYPGGTGLTSGSVFGKIAGEQAGKTNLPKP